MDLQRNRMNHLKKKGSSGWICWIWAVQCREWPSSRPTYVGETLRACLLLPRHREQSKRGSRSTARSGRRLRRSLGKRKRRMRGSRARGEHGHRNGRERMSVALASLLTSRRPERKGMKTATAIPGELQRFPARSCRGRRGKASCALGFARGALTRRRCVTAASAEVRFVVRRKRSGERAREWERGK